MILKNLRLTHFKNHDNATFDFINRINCVLGKNGVGKTNLLDAIYYLSFTKSAIGSQDRTAITHNAPAFTLFGTYDECTIAIQFEQGKSKTLKIDGVEPDSLSSVIGKVPLVMVLPEDTLMIKESSEARRKFFDGAISQFNRSYLEKLINYNKLLKQRNSMLKQQDRGIDFSLLDTYDEQLIPLSQEISSVRREISTSFLHFLEKNYADLHEGGEKPGLKFKTHVDDSFETAFKNSRDKDLIMQRTTMGCHRDDFEFLLDEEMIKKFGSQGQQKTFILALKLALYDYLKAQTKQKPLLLLDDIFDKLDDSRISLLVTLLKDSDRFGQIFISDARMDRSKILFESSSDVKFFTLG